MSSTTTKNDTANSGSPPPRTMLQEVEEALAQSMLVFLLADLRLMSATGRVETKYETIAIASDPPSRSTADELAGLDPDHTSTAVVHNQEEGLSPAQIMAVVMLELTKTVEARRKKDAERELAEAAGLSDEVPGYEGYSSWGLDKKSGTLKIQAQNDDMHSLLKAYADMIGKDLKTENLPHIQKRKSLLNLNPIAKEELDVVEEEDEEDDDIEEVDIEENPAFGQDTKDAMGRVAEGTKQVAEDTKQKMTEAYARRPTMLKRPVPKKDEEFGEFTDALYRQGMGTRKLRTSLAQSLGTKPKSFNYEELNDFVQKAVESRVYGKLDWLASFFKAGTVSKFMAESKSRIVWMNDWYPLKDLTYCIAVNKEIKRVYVVFRGAITSEDWSRAAESRNFRDVPNPVDEDYEGKTDTINMGSGFYQYLFRIRKDTGTKKYDEIANMAYKFAKERVGDDFQLVVYGHSLGGALSTIFSFYASADDRFTANGPVKCFNFGAPYVGGNKFVRAFCHQERSHLLMYARFFNHNDIVSHLPPNMRVTKEGGKFRHVGVGVRIPNVPYGLWGRVRGWHPKVFHIEDEGFTRSYWRAARNNFILKFPIPPWRFAQMHELNELQDRLMYGKLTGAGDDFELLQKPIEEVYDLVVGTSYATQGQQKDES